MDILFNIIGVVRLLFALSVNSNSHPCIKFVGREIAVQSSFYIAMIQSNYTSKINFWKSRYLSLYPTYIFCILTTYLLAAKIFFFKAII
ncbi:site-specific tyrosine recombinase XerC [Rickettsia canadensis str. McKiel]|uniref:Site-specific tyrosine recombinase XerC n=1 Tax=Rickettsia canadensis (strain McKiel) TaxID=293613 RepID=A8F040_RICCK|nr:hypothetical protein [Rickettsia canadensis]ABV73973.1 site-specific tyrosine recombinase XerC [Rickettsia canadensis str. McKiel]